MLSIPAVCGNHGGRRSPRGKARGPAPPPPRHSGSSLLTSREPRIADQPFLVPAARPFHAYRPDRRLTATSLTSGGAAAPPPGGPGTAALRERQPWRARYVPSRRRALGLLQARPSGSGSQWSSRKLSTTVTWERHGLPASVAPPPTATRGRGLRGARGGARCGAAGLPISRFVELTLVSLIKEKKKPTTSYRLSFSQCLRRV